jgi:hypothetical protein
MGCHAPSAWKPCLAASGVHCHISVINRISIVSKLQAAPISTDVVTVRARQGEIMDDITKSLGEMNLQERADLMGAVADVLQATAEEAEEDGDALAATNSLFLACNLRGCSSDLGPNDLKAAELLLEQGITFIHLLNGRKKSRELVH